MINHNPKVIRLRLVQLKRCQVVRQYGSEFNELRHLFRKVIIVYTALSLV